MVNEAKARITPKKTTRKKPAPTINVESPAVEVYPQINVDTAQLAAEVRALASEIHGTLTKVTDIIRVQQDTLNALVKQIDKLATQPRSNPAAKRPGSFDVAVTKADGSEVSMRVKAVKPH